MAPPSARPPSPPRMHLNSYNQTQAILRNNTSIHPFSFTFAFTFTFRTSMPNAAPREALVTLITISNSWVREAGFALSASLGYGDDSGIRKNQALHEPSRITFCVHSTTGSSRRHILACVVADRCGAESRWHILMWKSANSGRSRS